MTFELRIASNYDVNEWDTIISESPHGTLFHYWDWLKITEKHTGTRLIPLFGIKNGVTVGVFPLFFQRIGLIKMVFSPPPHASLFYLGPVMAGYDMLKQGKKEFIYSEFQKYVENFIKNDLKAHYTSISLSPNLQDPRPFSWSGYTTELNFDYCVNLSKGADYLFQTLDKKQRQNLNRAKNRKMIVEIGGKNEYEKILDLMENRYSQQGMHVTESRKYFLDIYDVYKDKIKIFVVTVDSEIITGSIDFQYKNTHYSWIGSPKPKNSISPSPNDLLMWESVRIAQEKGLEYYTTMSAAGDNRLHTYYASKFNPELKSYFSVKKSSFLAGIIEKGYRDIIKPLYGKMKPLKSGE
jgi:hypothetical protein